MCRRFAVTIFFILALVLNSAAQYTMKNLSVEDGLSNNYVKDIVQDKLGFIWIATESGLNRFDGQKFTTFTVSNSGLLDDAINTLFYDEKSDFLWIGTKTVLSMLDCETGEFTHFKEGDGIKINGIVDLEHASDEGIWITTHHHGILHYSKTTKRFSVYSNKTISGLKNSNWSSFDDGKGKLYIGHAQDGLSVIDLKTKSTTHYRNDPKKPTSIPGNSVYSIIRDHLGNIWMGTNQGLALFNQGTEDFLVFKHNPENPNSLIADHIYDIKEMNNGTLWIASDIGGISILDLSSISFADPKNVKFNNITATEDDSNLSSGNIRSLLQDSFGNIWVGNYSSGIDFISHTPSTFSTLPYTFHKAKKRKNKPVWGIYAEEQKVWVGGENEIVLFEDNKLKQTTDIRSYQSRPYAQVFSLIRNRQGTMFVGLYDDRLLRYDNKTERIEHIDLGIEGIDIITFCEAPNGKMWIGTEYGLYFDDNGTVYKDERITKQLGDKSIYGICLDHQEKLWIGTYGGGIYIFDKNRLLVYQLDLTNGFFSDAINHLYLDSHGGIWIGTRDGLGYIKDTATPANFDKYGTEHRLEDTFIRAIQEDLSGNIWVSTNKGISFWNKEKRRFNNYNQNDGIPPGNFIEGSACVTADGTVYFGSLNGVSYFKPSNVLAKYQVAPVQIIECKGFNKIIGNQNAEYLISPSEGMLDLKHNQNSFRISFAVPDYSQSQQVEYAYMVEGMDDSWYDTNGENQVTFRNMASGNYVFKVKARLKNQDWDEANIASLAIHIRPPFWLTWYAKLGYFILLSCIIFFYIRAYKRKLNLRSSLEIERRNNLNIQTLNNERLGFYTNITHELRTPLTLILGPLEDLTKDENVPRPYNEKITLIHRSALRLLNLINQILELRTVETENKKLTVAKENIANLITEIGLRYKELNQNPKVNFNINIQTNQPILYYDTDVITTILNNLLSNAIKYTSEGNITLSLRSIMDAGQEFTEIRVSDTGYGIAPEALPHIFDRYYQAKGRHQASGTGLGLALVKALVSLHEGSIQVESQLGEGTTFIFRISTDNTYVSALHSEPSSEPVPIEKEDTVLHHNEDALKEQRPVLLVVEDNMDIREYISSSFRDEYKIIEASNGKEGLELAFQRVPNIIVSDIMMPEMDGIAFCRIIKEDMRTSHIPVILLTAKDTIQDKEEGYETGADSYLTKPFSARLLKIRIQNLMSSRQKLAQQIASRTRELHPEPEQETLKLSKPDREFLEKLEGIIEENLQLGKLDISFMTEKLNMSHSTFYRKIKGLTGMSANEFIRKIKLKNSLRLLQSGEYNVSEAAYMTGFNNLGHFRESFKEEYGFLPSEYIK